MVRLRNPDSKIHGANMGPAWVLSAPDGPHVGPMNLAIRESFVSSTWLSQVHNMDGKNISYYILPGKKWTTQIISSTQHKVLST